ncbi:uncharacterized protein LOC107653656 [Sinocyclocheilus anshuiensis]|uniref:uncharacterized protein LOC107653656 n=1 Tax=Sinocyclocheilus anshuiensis TaxID=1608454 RepID=UPI0007B85F15|nr:PREDICTED: uncharacterized protein LOC107653656 [Sinocyclocheilus anshuiensis]
MPRLTHAPNRSSSQLTAFRLLLPLPWHSRSSVWYSHAGFLSATPYPDTPYGQHFTFTTKRGICKGRQILVFEDAEGNEESRILSLNLYHNGTVMIQGSEPALQAFTVAFIQIKQQAHLNTSFMQDHKDTNTNSSPVKDIQKKTTTATALIQSPMSKMKEKFSLLEIDMVELKELIMSQLKDNSDLEQLKKDMMNLKQETEYLQRNKEQMSKELHQAREELKEFKSTFRRQITEIKTEMQEELSVLKSELRKKDELINNMKEQLLHVSSSKASHAKHLSCLETPTDNQQSPAADEPRSSSDPQTKAHRTAPHNPTQTEALILIDSNGKYINEKLLFPKMKAQKMWCPNTSKALQILSDKNLNETYKHIIIHTGTNDLRAAKGNVAPVLREVALRASERFPEAKITLSTLLPRSDVPLHVIHGNNAELSRSCALIPNVHLAYHKDIRPHHMYDYIHLNKKGVQLFARVLKSTAFGKTGDKNLHSKSSSQPQRNVPPPPRSRQDSTPGAPSQSYAAAVQQPQNPAAAELNHIRHLLNIICSKLVK